MNVIASTMNVMDEIWMGALQKYEMSQKIQTLYSIREGNCSCISVTDAVGLNWQNNEW